MRISIDTPPLPPVCHLLLSSSTPTPHLLVSQNANKEIAKPPLPFPTPCWLADFLSVSAVWRESLTLSPLSGFYNQLQTSIQPPLRTIVNPTKTSRCLLVVCPRRSWLGPARLLGHDDLVNLSRKNTQAAHGRTETSRQRKPCRHLHLKVFSTTAHQADTAVHMFRTHETSTTKRATTVQQ